MTATVKSRARVTKKEANITIRRNEPQRAPALVTFDAQRFLATVGAGKLIAKFKPRETIFLQGDPADAVFYIQKGKVQITVLSRQGKQGVVAVLGAGEFFGE